MLHSNLIASELRPIAAKIENGQRLDFDDGVVLYRTHDLIGLGHLANFVRERINGNYAYFIVNRHINHTNVCANRCRFCAYYRQEGQEGAYTMPLEEVFAAAVAHAAEGISELHIVGGLHPTLPYSYYLDMMRGLKERLPGVVLQAFTMVEIDHIAQIGNRSIREALEDLKAAGLDSIPGGGAEVFAREVRDLLCEKKISGERWLEVARTAHELGIKSNATMLYGHVETIEQRVDHLIRLRALQDETDGFLAFIPLAFHPENTEVNHGMTTTGVDDLKNLAVARLVLDNFPHIKAFWIMIGPKLAQISLSFGVDDIDGTVIEERITHSAGATTAQGMRRSDLVHLIREAGRVPVERDTLYNIRKIES
jgi:aminodeoxyfutalosine synthase